MIWIVALLLPPTAIAFYYAYFIWHARRETSPQPAEPRSMAILIPAHNEERTLAECIQSVWASHYPRELVRVLVVADNCTDGTAELARLNGAECLERFNTTHKGKGYALQLGLARIFQTPPEAVLILDSDCQLLPDTLQKLNDQLQAGHRVIQAAVHIRNGEASPAALVAAAGGEVENLLSLGFSNTGRVVHLRGTGMIFHRGILEQYPWTAFGLTEDAEYSETLRRAGVPVHFTQHAAITTDAPISSQSLAQQRSRWRESLFVDRKRLLERWLMSKPVVMAHLFGSVVLAGLFSLNDATAIILVGIWTTALIANWAMVYRQALQQLNLPWSAFWSLFGTPLVVARLAFVTVQGLLKRGGTWQRTARVS